VIEKQQNQSLQKQVKELHTANTTLQGERDKLMEDAQVLITAAILIKEIYFMYCLTLCTSSFKNVVFFLVSSDK
jgi:cell division protein FtsB